MKVKYTVVISSFPDFQDRKGLWVKDFAKTIGDTIYKYTTRAGKLYEAVKKRTRVVGCINNETTKYKDSWNLFNDFQAFAEWCQTQDGYLNKEISGKFWSIDKDILVPGNKNYSEDTCCFVPVSINNILRSKPINYSSEPMGVHYDKTRNKYVAQSSTTKLGRYDTAMEAHKAWQVSKIEILKSSAKHPLIGEKVKEGLLRWADIIKKDFDSGVETTIY